MKTTNDKISFKQVADDKFAQYKKDIEFYISEGISKEKAFNLVMDKSTLGQGYRAQMKKEFDISIFA